MPTAGTTDVIYSLHVLLFALVLAFYVHACVHLVKQIFDFSYWVSNSTVKLTLARNAELVLVYKFVWKKHVKGMQMLFGMQETMIYTKMWWPRDEDAQKLAVQKLMRVAILACILHTWVSRFHRLDCMCSAISRTCAARTCPACFPAESA